jgi:hypothetical protein
VVSPVRASCIFAEASDWFSGFQPACPRLRGPSCWGGDPGLCVVVFVLTLTLHAHLAECPLLRSFSARFFRKFLGLSGLVVGLAYNQGGGMSGAGSPACPQGVPLVGPGVPRGRDGLRRCFAQPLLQAKDLFGCPSAGVGPAISAAAPERNAPKALSLLLSSYCWHLVATGCRGGSAAFYLRGGRTSFTWWRRIGGLLTTVVAGGATDWAMNRDPLAVLLREGMGRKNLWR